MSAFTPAVSTVTAARGSAFSGARFTSRSAAMPAKPLRRAVLTRAGPGETLIQVEKPLGVNLKASNKGISGGVEVASARGNAAKAGLKAGDYIVYCSSSFFGDELWPADQLGFCPIRHPGVPQPGGLRRRARPQDRRKHRRQAPSQAPRAPALRQEALRRAEGARHPHPRRLRLRVHPPHPFVEQGKEYVCPQCNAPRSRFARYDVETGRAIGGSKAPLITTAATVLGLGGIAYYLTQLL